MSIGIHPGLTDPAYDTTEPRSHVYLGAARSHLDVLQLLFLNPNVGDVLGPEAVDNIYHALNHVDCLCSRGIEAWEAERQALTADLESHGGALDLLMPQGGPNSIDLHPITSAEMEPKLKVGDLVVLDATVRTITGDGIYLLEAGDWRTVCRVQVLFGGGYRISYDNPLFDASTMTREEMAAVTVAGRAVSHLARL